MGRVKILDMEFVFIYLQQYFFFTLVLLKQFEDFKEALGKENCETDLVSLIIYMDEMASSTFYAIPASSSHLFLSEFEF